MKMKNGLKKTRIIVCMVIMSIMLAAYGWGETVPNLINADDPFIELDSIGDSIGNAKTAYENAHPTPMPTPIPTLAPDDPTPTEVPPNEKEITIMIGDERMSGSGETITLDGVQKKSFEELRTAVAGTDHQGEKYILIDCYAENITFRTVKGILDEAGVSYVIESWNESSAE